MYAAARSGLLVFAEMWIGTLAEPIATALPLSPGGMSKNIASSPSPSLAVAAFQLPPSMNAPSPLPNAAAASESLRELNESPRPR